LYSMLGYVSSEHVNIMTLEDPVEYPMDMIRQTSINEVLRMDFANGIRSLMRQDPDIILVGEIRDSDTAEMAFRAAMTGHQVYSTLHTNSAIGSIPRLIDIGIKTNVMTGNIIGILGQRLVRKLCLHCRTSHSANDFELTLMGLDADSERIIFEAQGCEACEHTGYRGRIAILEVLRISSEIDELIAEQQTIGKIKSYLKKSGFQSLADDATRRVLDGITTLDEVTRVIDLTGRL